MDKKVFAVPKGNCIMYGDLDFYEGRTVEINNDINDQNKDAFKALADEDSWVRPQNIKDKK